MYPPWPARRGRHVESPRQVVRRLPSLPSKLLTLSIASDRFDQILSQFSRVVVEAIRNSHPRCTLLLGLLRGLCDSEHRSDRLTEMAYNWCSVVCENYDSLTLGKHLLPRSLQIGFRHLGYDNYFELAHTNHHRRMANIIFESGDNEAIADLLHAWTSDRNVGGDELLVTCVEHLVRLRPEASPLRLRRLVIRSVEHIGYRGFERVGVEAFGRLLDDLSVSVGDTFNQDRWIRLLVDTIRSPEGARRLSHPYWELLVELTISTSWMQEDIASSPHTVTILKDDGEWDKLECWIAVVWMLWPPEEAAGDLQTVTLSLFHQRPDAIRRLEQRVEEWDPYWRDLDNLNSLQRICEQASAEAVSRDRP